MLLKAERIDVESFIFLRGADVMKDGSGGDGGTLMANQAEAFERFDFELALDEGDGEVVGEDPVLNAGAGGDAFKRSGNFCAGCEEDFTGRGEQ